MVKEYGDSLHWVVRSSAVVPPEVPYPHVIPPKVVESLAALFPCAHRQRVHHLRVVNAACRSCQRVKHYTLGSSSASTCSRDVATKMSVLDARSHVRPHL